MRKYIRTLKAQYAVAVLAGALLVGGGAAIFEQNAHAKEKVASARLQVDETPVQREKQMVTSFSSVVKKVSPSVVKVYTTFKAQEGARPEMNQFFEDPMFRRFFGDQLRGGEGMRRSPMPKQTGLGSGVIVTKDGYVLTNNHVVENADEVKVQIGDRGDEYTAKVVGTDPKTDIALLKIDAKDKSFPAVTSANSDQLQVGDVVLAVGNPFGIGQTVTMGIVSATGRATLGLEYEDFIQTDAAINMGNSGGALVDAEGRLVGINTAILSRTGGNQGIGFAVPINLAGYVMDSLIQNGRVIRGFMGVNIQDVTPGLAEKFELKEREGALVSEVTPDSPAEEAGLKPGDVVLEFNGKPVRDSRNLKLSVAQVAPGKEVPVKISRDGKVEELNVKLKEFPQDKQLAKNSGNPADSGDVTDGITVDDITPEARQQFNIPRNLKGALVLDVEPESPGYEAGLRPGDVIVEMNRNAVRTSEEAVKLSDGLKDDVLLRIWSRGGTRYVVLKNDGKKVG
ncbi:MAG TPA: Do family serine endopeptidase [Verrucomicrobiae bacterium]